MMTLQELVISYAASKDVQPVTVAQYERSIRFFSTFCGHEATPEDLAEFRVNLWVKNLQGRLDPVTVKNYLIGLLTIWNFAASEELCGEYKRTRIRRPKIPEKVIRAWNDSQVSSLENAARNVTGTLHGGCQVSVYMTAYVMTAQDTMFRPGDMRRIKWEDLQGDVIRIVQSKTGTRITKTLRLDTVAAVECLRRFAREDGLIFWLAKGGQRVHENKVRHLAGVFEKGRALGKLRHWGATKIAPDKGVDAASKSLGHKPGSNVAPRFYIADDESSPGPWGETG